jgi:hypothetical protein
MTTRETGRRNSEYDWNKFDPNAYRQQYEIGKKQRDRPLLEDRLLGGFVVNAVRRIAQHLEIEHGSMENAIDVGNAGVVRGPAISAPLVRRDSDGGAVYWSDFGDPQLNAAAKVIEMGKDRNLGEWDGHQVDLADAHPLWKNSVYRACDLGQVRKQSIFDLEEGEFDIATAFFTPESLTGNREEYEAAAHAFFRCARRLVAMAYMIESDGYESAGQFYPATPVTTDEVVSLARRSGLSMIQAVSIDGTGAARPDGDTTHYSGMGALVGVRQ